MLVLFEIYKRKLIIRIESCFWSLNEGMNDEWNNWREHFVCRQPYNVRIGYSIHTFIKWPKSTFNS